MAHQEVTCNFQGIEYTHKCMSHQGCIQSLGYGECKMGCITIGHWPMNGKWAHQDRKNVCQKRCMPKKRGQIRSHKIEEMYISKGVWLKKRVYGLSRIGNCTSSWGYGLSSGLLTPQNRGNAGQTGCMTDLEGIIDTQAYKKSMS